MSQSSKLKVLWIQKIGTILNLTGNLRHLMHRSKKAISTFYSDRVGLALLLLESRTKSGHLNHLFRRVYRNLQLWSLFETSLLVRQA